MFNDLYRRGEDLREGCKNAGQDRTQVEGVHPSVSMFASGPPTSSRGCTRRSVPMVHATFQYSGTEGKRHGDARHCFGRTPPEYSTRLRLLVFTPDVPKSSSITRKAWRVTSIS